MTGIPPTKRAFIFLSSMTAPELSGVAPLVIESNVPLTLALSRPLSALRRREGSRWCRGSRPARSCCRRHHAPLIREVHASAGGPGRNRQLLQGIEMPAWLRALVQDANDFDEVRLNGAIVDHVHRVSHGTRAAISADMPEVKAPDAGQQIVASPRGPAVRISGDRSHGGDQQPDVPPSGVVAPALGARRDDLREVRLGQPWLDPLTAAVCTLKEIREMATEMLEAQRAWLPEFADRRIRPTPMIHIPPEVRPVEVPLDPALAIHQRFGKLVSQQTEAWRCSLRSTSMR